MHGQARLQFPAAVVLLVVLNTGQDRILCSRLHEAELAFTEHGSLAVQWLAILRLPGPLISVARVIDEGAVSIQPQCA